LIRLAGNEAASLHFLYMKVFVQLPNKRGVRVRQHEETPGLMKFSAKTRQFFMIFIGEPAPVIAAKSLVVGGV
jgi:hypothetical protein